jgi:hypothetical protein
MYARRCEPLVSCYKVGCFPRTQRLEADVFQDGVRDVWKRARLCHSPSQEQLVTKECRSLFDSGSEHGLLPSYAQRVNSSTAWVVHWETWLGVLLWEKYLGWASGIFQKQPDAGVWREVWRLRIANPGAGVHSASADRATGSPTQSTFTYRSLCLGAWRTFEFGLCNWVVQHGISYLYWVCRVGYKRRQRPDSKLQ